MEKEIYRELRDKRRYKGKTKKDFKHRSVKSTCNLESNWDRYEKEDLQDFHIDSSTDFATLSNAPIIQGHHFQFKSDKVIAEETGNKVASQFFSLDLELLKCNILTVPFYCRMGIDQKYFVENEIKFMNKDAEDNLIKHSRIEVPLESGDDTEDDTENIHYNTTENKIEHVSNLAELATKVDEIKKMNEVTPINSDNDLEQWLDDILDD